MLRFFLYGLFLWGISSGLAGCRPDECRVWPGEETTMERVLEDFSGVEIQDVFDVTFRNDTVFRVAVTGGEHLLDGIRTTVTGEKLILSDQNRCRWLHSFSSRIGITVYSPKIDFLEITGESRVFFEDTIRTDDFRFEIWAGLAEANLLLDSRVLRFSINGCSGDYTLSGQAEKSFIYSAGNAFVHAFSFQTKRSEVTQRSTGDIFITVSESLTVKIQGSGDVYYRGNPNEIIIPEDFSGGKLVNAN